LLSLLMKLNLLVRYVKFSYLDCLFVHIS